MGSVLSERKIEESPTLCTMVILCDEAQSCSTPHHKKDDGLVAQEKEINSKQSLTFSFI